MKRELSPSIHPKKKINSAIPKTHAPISRYIHISIRPCADQRKRTRARVYTRRYRAASDPRRFNGPISARYYTHLDEREIKREKDIGGVVRCMHAGQMRPSDKATSVRVCVCVLQLVVVFSWVVD